MIRFEGKHCCSRCGNNYDWVIAKPDIGEAVFGRMDDLHRNVLNCTALNVPGQYSIELECPKCGNREFVDRSSS